MKKLLIVSAILMTLDAAGAALAADLQARPILLRRPPGDD